MKEVINLDITIANDFNRSLENNYNPLDGLLIQVHNNNGVLFPKFIWHLQIIEHYSDGSRKTYRMGTDRKEPDIKDYGYIKEDYIKWSITKHIDGNFTFESK